MIGADGSRYVRLRLTRSTLCTDRKRYEMNEVEPAFPTGGCACGAVRYRLKAEPYDTGWCHCRICQHLSGAAGLVFTTVPIQAYEIRQGSDRIGSYGSTSFGARTFCQQCGAPLTIHVEHQPDEIDIAVGSLDDTNAVSPGFHIFAAEAPAWVLFNDDLPKFEAFRPDTRGLPSGVTSL